jgi:hypothetical protein
MNREIMKMMGFDKELSLIDEGRCPFCQKMVYLNDFRDELSVNEFRISGLCQQCQDKTFDGDE